jgi:hypothetical protein
VATLQFHEKEKNMATEFYINSTPMLLYVNGRRHKQPFDMRMGINRNNRGLILLIPILMATEFYINYVPMPLYFNGRRNKQPFDMRMGINRNNRGLKMKRKIHAYGEN